MRDLGEQASGRPSIAGSHARSRTMSARTAVHSSSAWRHTECRALPASVGSGYVRRAAGRSTNRACRGGRRWASSSSSVLSFGRQRGRGQADGLDKRLRRISIIVAWAAGSTSRAAAISCCCQVGGRSSWLTRAEGTAPARNGQWHLRIDFQAVHGAARLFDAGDDRADQPRARPGECRDVDCPR